MGLDLRGKEIFLGGWVCGGGFSIFEAVSPTVLSETRQASGFLPSASTSGPGWELGSSAGMRFSVWWGSDTGRNGGRAPAPSLQEMLLSRQVLNPGGAPTFHLHRGG